MIDVGVGQDDRNGALLEPLDFSDEVVGREAGVDDPAGGVGLRLVRIVHDVAVGLERTKREAADRGRSDGSPAHAHLTSPLPFTTSPTTYTVSPNFSSFSFTASANAGLTITQ